jgi:hypothetical protein
VSTDYHYGKKLARSEAVLFKFSNYFDLERLPNPNTVFGHYPLVKDWGILGNDKHGNCVLAGGDHEEMIWNAEGKHDVLFNETTALADYSALTGYDPNDPTTDHGTDMSDAAEYRRKTGLIDVNGNRHKVDAYVSLKVGDVKELVAATYLFGAVGVGLYMPSYAMKAFINDEPWIRDASTGFVGGHYVPCVGRNSRDFLLVVTWGRLHSMSPEFYQQFNDETIAYISLDALDAKGLSPEGFDKAALTSYLNRLRV